MSLSDTSRPLISIITPSFNQGRFLPEAIDSVLSQGFTDFEYIIIDGGSNDNSQEIIKKNEKFLKYWVSEQDGGQSHGINKGFRRASGRLVAWLNADDLYLPDCFEVMADTYLANPHCSFYYGNGYRGDESGRAYESFYKKGTAQYSQGALAYGLNYILQPSTFMSNEAMKTVGYVREELNYGMDSDLWLRLAAVATPMAVGAHLSISREYETTKTSSGSFQRVEELRQIAQEHTGLEMTPGAMLYFLDCLNASVASSRASGDQTFSAAYPRHIQKFWKQTAKLLEKYQVGKDGIPRKTIKNG